MANHVSALKRARQSEKRRVRNRAVRTRVRNLVKNVRQAVEEGDQGKAQEALKVAGPAIDRAAGKGVIHKNTAARTISRLSRKVNTLGS